MEQNIFCIKAVNTMIKRLSCAVAGMCLMASMTTACSLGQGIEVFDQDKIVLLQTEEMIQGEDIAVVETSEGIFKMRFFPSEAPKTVENFIELAQSGYFDGQKVSRIEKIQQADRVKGRIVAGSGKPVGEKGKSIFEKPIQPEISYNLCTIPGAVVAYTPEDEVDSRFYIVGSRKVSKEEIEEIRQNNYPNKMIQMFEEHGGYPEEWLHQSVFAQVVDGMEIVDQIIQEHDSTAIDEVTDIEILQIRIEKYDDLSEDDSSQEMTLMDSRMDHAS